MNHVLPRASPYAVVVVREEKRDFPGSWVHHHRHRLPLSPCTSSITSGHHLQSFKLGDGAIVTELMDAVAMPISVHIQSLFLLLFFIFIFNFQFRLFSARKFLVCFRLCGAIIRERVSGSASSTFHETFVDSGVTMSTEM